jgi:eukaryotic-like serine/threonine-protein kinase
MGTAPEANNRPCPTLAELAAFLYDELPHDAMDDIGAHVSGCPHCDAVVRRMDEATDNGLPGRRHSVISAGADAPVADNGPALATVPPVVRAVPVDRLSQPFQLGQYRIGERIGRGGMGAVYRAEHIRLKKSVAVKILSTDPIRDRRSAARFQLEMEVVGKLDHPNIVRATDAGEASGVHFLVMELIEGTNLAHLLLRHGPLSVPDACELVRQAAIGLQHAHEHGLVHRDVKPSNLMLSNAGVVKLLDLGLALLRSSGPSAPDLTGVGEVMGTAEYMAPEQWAETHSVDIRADIYSLGCTLYALLTGDPPFTGSGRSFLRMMSAHQQSPVPPITDVRSDLPPALCAFIGRLLAKAPDDRPATPGEVAAELAAFTEGADLSRLVGPVNVGAPLAPRPTPTPATPRTPIGTVADVPRAALPRRRRWALVLAVTVAVIAVAAVSAGIFAVVNAARDRGAPRSEEPPHDPTKWRSVLKERPGARLWVPHTSAFCNHDADKEILRLGNPRGSLLSLGNSPARAYKLQIGFQQTLWQGGIGVYFGGRPNADNEFVFQFVNLIHAKHGKGREFALGRSLGSFPLDRGRKQELAEVAFGTEHLAPLASGEHLLELEVLPEGLASVRWNGTACPKLVDEPVFSMAQNNSLPKKRDPSDLTGEFGIYCNGAVVTVSTARFVVTE